MFINTENIHSIVIRTTEKPVDFEQFKNFIYKSPFVRRIAFIGNAIFEMPEFIEMIQFCATNNIYLIFGEVKENSTEKMRALVEYKNVLLVNIHENKGNVKAINEYKKQFNSDLPNVYIIKPEKRVPQDELSNTSFAFYNLADDIEKLPCLNLLKEPMLDYNGNLLGCWVNPDKKHSINAFKLGMDNALNKTQIKNMLNMLKTGKIRKSCSCTRCPVFASLIWTDQKIDVYKKVFNQN